METEKDKAIADYAKRRKEEAKEAFQAQVNTVLSEISTLSNQLKAAKNRLMELEYKEPETVDY